MIARRNVYTLIVLSLFLQALVPVGFMPDTDAGMIICPHHQDNDNPQTPEKEFQLCDYAPVISFDLQPVQNPLPETVVWQAGFQPLLQEHVATHLRIGLYQTRAPPMAS